MVIPGVAHHVTQRGNRRERIFLEEGDEQVYLDLLSEQLRRYRVTCWAYCLMPNHVRLILVPSDEAGLARTVGEAHRRYTGLSALAADGQDICFRAGLARWRWMKTALLRPFAMWHSTLSRPDW
jgi:REP element-mobilizing transposase RayT